MRSYWKHKKLLLFIAISFVLGVSVYQIKIKSFAAKKVILTIAYPFMSHDLEGNLAKYPDFNNKYYKAIKSDVMLRHSIPDKELYNFSEVLEIVRKLRSEVGDKAIYTDTHPLSPEYFSLSRDIREHRKTGKRKLVCSLFISYTNLTLTSMKLVTRSIDLTRIEDQLKSPWDRLKANFVSPTSSIFDRHNVLEVYLPLEKRWVLIDAWYGIVFEKHGRFLSAIDIQESNGDNIKLVYFHELSKKVKFTKEEYMSYFGQITISRNFSLSKTYHPLKNTLGSAYYAYDLKMRNTPSFLYKLFHWEHKRYFNLEEEKQRLRYIQNIYAN